MSTVVEIPAVLVGKSQAETLALLAAKECTAEEASARIDEINAVGEDRWTISVNKNLGLVVRNPRIMKAWSDSKQKHYGVTLNLPMSAARALFPMELSRGVVPDHLRDAALYAHQSDETLALLLARKQAEQQAKQSS